MTNRMARPRDLLFTTIDQLPEGLTLQSDNMIVRGQSTSHVHRLHAIRVLQDAHGMLFLQALSATQAVHLEPGCSRVSRQREETPEARHRGMD